MPWGLQLYLGWAAAVAVILAFLGLVGFDTYLLLRKTKR